MLYLFYIPYLLKLSPLVVRRANLHPSICYQYFHPIPAFGTDFQRPALAAVRYFIYCKL